MDETSLEIEFSITICSPKTWFLAIFDPRSSIFESVFDCRLSGVIYAYGNYLTLDRLVSSDVWVSVRSFHYFVRVHMQ